jgi:hypothetical protein
LFKADEYILTTAHCVDGFSSFKVVLGDRDEEGHLELTTTTAFVHPEWDSSDVTNNIAIIQIPKIIFSGKKHF